MGTSSVCVCVCVCCVNVFVCVCVCVCVCVWVCMCVVCVVCVVCVCMCVAHFPFYKHSNSIMISVSVLCTALTHSCFRKRPSAKNLENYSANTTCHLNGHLSQQGLVDNHVRGRLWHLWQQHTALFPRQLYLYMCVCVCLYVCGSVPALNNLSPVFLLNLNNAMIVLFIFIPINPSCRDFWYSKLQISCYYSIVWVSDIEAGWVHTPVQKLQQNSTNPHMLTVWTAQLWYSIMTNLLTPWSEVLLEKLTSLCS
jgi:hypothetical protein